MPPTTHIVYKATSPSGKVYVGITGGTLRKRQGEHFTAARRAKNPLYFQRALLKYGQAMQWEIIESGIVGVATAGEREKHHIALLGSNDPGKGYNGTSGGATGPFGQTPTTEHRQKIREALSQPVLRSDGRVFASMSEASQVMGAKAKDAVGKAIRNGGTCGGYTFKHISREAMQSLIGADPAATAAQTPVVWTMSRKLSDDARQRISKANKGKCRRSAESEARRACLISKRVYRTDGVVFDSMRAAGASVGLDQDGIAYAIRQQRVVEGHLFSLQPVGASELAGATTCRAKRDSERRAHVRAARSKPLYCSDGRTFPSLTEAAKTLGIDRGDLTYLVKVRRAICNLQFSRTPFTHEAPNGAF